jgi:hypothetical protein
VQLQLARREFVGVDVTDASQGGLPVSAFVKPPRRDRRGFLIMSHLDYSRSHRSAGLSLAL